VEVHIIEGICYTLQLKLFDKVAHKFAYSRQQIVRSATFTHTKNSPVHKTKITTINMFYGNTHMKIQAIEKKQRDFAL